MLRYPAPYHCAHHLKTTPPPHTLPLQVRITGYSATADNSIYYFSVRAVRISARGTSKGPRGHTTTVNSRAGEKADHQDVLLASFPAVISRSSLTHRSCVSSYLRPITA